MDRSESKGGAGRIKTKTFNKPLPKPKGSSDAGIRENGGSDANNIKTKTFNKPGRPQGNTENTNKLPARPAASSKRASMDGSKASASKTGRNDLSRTAGNLKDSDSSGEVASGSLRDSLPKSMSTTKLPPARTRPGSGKATPPTGTGTVTLRPQKGHANRGAIEKRASLVRILPSMNKSPIGSDGFQENSIPQGFRLLPSFLARPISSYGRKRGGGKKSKAWKKRFFDLSQEGVLSYRKKEGDDPQGVINMSEVLDIRRSTDGEFGIDIVLSYRTFHFSFFNEEDASKWNHYLTRMMLCFRLLRAGRDDSKELSGVLKVKRGKSRWKKRFSVVNQHGLTTYKTDKARAPVLIIPLVDVEVMARDKSTFEISSKRTREVFLLQVPKSRSVDSWVSAVKAYTMNSGVADVISRYKYLDFSCDTLRRIIKIIGESGTLAKISRLIFSGAQYFVDRESIDSNKFFDIFGVPLYMSMDASDELFMILSGNENYISYVDLMSSFIIFSDGNPYKKVELLFYTIGENAQSEVVIHIDTLNKVIDKIGTVLSIDHDFLKKMKKDIAFAAVKDLHTIKSFSGLLSTSQLVMELLFLTSFEFVVKNLA